MYCRHTHIQYQNNIQLVRSAPITVAELCKTAMKHLSKCVKDKLAIISAVLLKTPNKRFDEIVGSEQEKYTDTIGSTALVTEIVSSTSGMVRYSGSNWRARLSENSACTSINTGQVVRIESLQGIVLVVV